MGNTPAIGSLWKSSKKGIGAFVLEQAKWNSNYFCKIQNFIELTPENVLMYLGDSTLKVIDLEYDAVTDVVEERFVEERTAVFLLDSKMVHIFYEDYKDLWEKDTFMKNVTGCNT